MIDLKSPVTFSSLGPLNMYLFIFSHAEMTADLDVLVPGESCHF